jgi:hypothetical protein
MRPSIPVWQDASERLRLLHDVPAIVRLVLHLHKDEMQARSKPSITPHFVREDEEAIVKTNLFLREQPKMKLSNRQFGPFTFMEKIGKHS